MNALEVRERMRIWIMNVDFQDLITSRTAGFQLSHRLVVYFWVRSYVFEFRRHNDREVGFRVLAATVYFLLILLTEINET